MGFVRSEYCYIKFIIFSLKKKGESYIKSIIIKAGIIKKTSYETKITGEILLLKNIITGGISQGESHRIIIGETL